MSAQSVAVSRWMTRELSHRFARRVALQALLLASCLTLGCGRYESRVITRGPLTLPARTWITLHGDMRAASDVGQLCLQLPPEAERLVGTSGAPAALALPPAAMDSLPARPLRITARFYRADGTLVPAASAGNARRSPAGSPPLTLDCVKAPFRTRATYIRADIWASDTVTIRRIWWESYTFTAGPSL